MAVLLQQNVNIILDDTPVYCRETVEYICEPIAMVVGPDEKVVDKILSEIQVNYEELEPMLDLRKADFAFFDYEFGHGDMEKAFAEADKVYEEEFETGYQDQTYLEPQGMMANLVKKGSMTSTRGMYHFPVPIPEMIEEVNKLCMIPTAPACAHAYYRYDGKFRQVLPLEDTPYRKK